MKDKKELNDFAQSFGKRSNKKQMKRMRKRQATFEFVLKSSYLLKRSMDLIFSLIFLILFSPIFLFTAIAIYLEDPGTIFYSQTRVGKNGREFDFYKFRSMVMNADKLKDQLLQQNESGDGVIFKMKRDPRITKVGRIIRRFSIDELPQLLNVLKGDMSLVGPRPPLPREVAEYSIEDHKRLDVIPGITCIWQVSGRSDIPFEQQVELDKQYIREYNGIWSDISLLLRTVGAVFSGKGAY
ncbi:MAG: sugar transferase [Candidatus Cloacimonadales bacterium]